MTEPGAAGQLPPPSGVHQYLWVIPGRRVRRVGSGNRYGRCPIDRQRNTGMTTIKTLAQRALLLLTPIAAFTVAAINEGAKRW